MNAVRFHVVIGDSGSLSVPEGVVLTPGPAEIIVLQDKKKDPDREADSQETPSQRLARRARDLSLHGLPSDMAANHDHYLHGLPKGIDEQ